MSIGDLSILWDLWFLSWGTWSYCYTGLSLVWLKLHQDIFYYLWLLWREFFPNFFLSLFIICIKEGYWFIWVNFISGHFAEVVYHLENFSGRVFGLLMYNIISSANSDTFISSLPICIPLISFCCLSVLASTLSTILNRYGGSGYPCLVSDFSGIASSMSPFNLILAVGLQ